MLTAVLEPTNCVTLDDLKKLYLRFFSDFESEQAGGNERQLPRLEFILGRLEAVLGEKCFATILSVFGHATPNEAHRWLAWKAQRGARLITSNFDMLIEVADPSARVFHYHGCYDASTECGATLKKIALGLPAGVAAAVDGLLSESAVTLFLGYHGLDFYDINPFFQKKHRAFQRGIYIDFATGKPLKRVATIPPRIKPLTEGFKSFDVYSGDPRSSLYGSESHSCGWKDHISTAIASAGRARLKLLAADILLRMGLAETARQVLDGLDHADQKSLSDAEAGKVYELTVRASYSLSQFRRVFSLLKCDRRSPRRAVHPERRRYYCVCSVLFGVFWLRAPWYILTAIIRLRRFSRSRFGWDEVLGLHADAHLLHQALIQVEARAVRFPKPVQRVFADAIRWLRKQLSCVVARLLADYEKAATAGKVEYDEEAYGYMRTAAGYTDWREVRTRWAETDSLTGVVLAMRHGIKAELRNRSDGQKVDCSQRALRGLHLAELINNYLEAIMWAALVRKHFPEQTLEADRIERQSLKVIELSRVGTRIVLARAREQATFGF